MRRHTPLTRTYQLAFSTNAIERAIPAYLVQSIRAHSQRQAVVSRDRSYNYSELDHCSSQVAGAILQRSRPDEETIVLLMDRCPQMIVGLLGILKSGKVCVPLLSTIVREPWNSLPLARIGNDLFQPMVQQKRGLS